MARVARVARLNQTLDASNTGLILFDALQGYLNPKDPEKVKFLAERNIVPNLQRLLEGARRVGINVFYPAGAHAPDGSDTVARLTDTDMDLAPFGGGTKTIKPRFAKGSQEATIATSLAPQDGDAVIAKQRWNAFHQTNLDLQLRARGIGTIVIAGGSTDVGIASTVFAARDMDYGIVVVRDACYSARGPNHDFFMERVFPRMARVRSVDETVKLMRPET